MVTLPLFTLFFVWNKLFFQAIVLWRLGTVSALRILFIMLLFSLRFYRRIYVLVSWQTALGIFLAQWLLDLLHKLIPWSSSQGAFASQIFWSNQLSQYEGSFFLCLQSVIVNNQQSAVAQGNRCQLWLSYRNASS